MPYENEHSCRLADPGSFDRFARKNAEQKHDGKAIDVIYGFKGDKSQIQALRYDKKVWTADAASTHCESRDGSFEAATKEAAMDVAALSMGDRRDLLQGAVKTKFAAGTDSWAWVQDVWDDKLVYSLKDQSFEVPYTIDDQMVVALGTPVKVSQRTVYDPMEALRTKYADVVQEAGKRGQTEDKRVKDLIGSSLRGSRVTNEQIYDTMKEADSVLAWLKEQKVTKTEGPDDYPAAAYAYVPDPELSSTWKLRLWENPTLKVTRVQLGRAAAALSPGGFRGQKVDIPSEDLPAVKRRIRVEYRKLDVPDEEIPRWVKESEQRSLFTNFTSLTEAEVDTKGIAKIIVIKPGFGNPVDNHYYPAETLARDFSMFEGIKMYADHQTEEEEKSRPEGSIRQWVASLKNVEYKEGIGVVGDAVIIEPWLQAKLAVLRDKKLLSEMGISIRAAGIGTKGKMEGKDTNVVERITQVRSVDFVTEAGAGGMVTLYEAGASQYDVDVVSLEELKSRRPDLVKIIETEVKTKILREVKTMAEQEDKIKELETNLTTLTTERDGLKVKITESEKAQKKAEAKSVIDKAISESGLPAPSKARLTESFKETETATGIAEAIKTETKYIADLAEAGKVKGMGPTSPEDNKEKDHKDLIESFKRTGMSDKSAEIAANAR
jgi:hypothetical protein